MNWFQVGCLIYRLLKRIGARGHVLIVKFAGFGAIEMRQVLGHKESREKGTSIVTGFWGHLTNFFVY
jgi:hypothetical protein